MRARQFLFEYESAEQLKAEILKTINSIDTNIPDEQVQQQNTELLDRVYTILNKSNVTDRFQSVLPNVLRGEYSDAEVMKIAGKIAEAPISYKEKVEFTKNLEKNRVINHKLLLTPGHYTIDDLCFGNATNKAMFDHLKAYGVGQKMKGPAEHALAILSSNISIQGKGDVDVDGTPVEVKAAIGASGAGGRFGETGEVPNLDRIMDVINGTEWLAPIVAQHLQRQKSMNLDQLVKYTNSVEGLQPQQRKAFADSLFGTIFGNEGALVANAFAQPNADPTQVYHAYVKSNFNWYKNSDMGGAWQLLAGINFKTNAVAVVKDANDLDNITRLKSTIYIIYGKPMEMLYQFNPKNL